MKKCHLKIFFIMFLCALVAGWYCYHFYYVPSRLQKFIEFPSDIDLGIIAPGETKEFEVLARSSLSYPVRLAQIETTCGCITVGIDEPTLFPNATLSIVFTFVAPGVLGKTEKMIAFQAFASSDAAWFVNVSATVFADVWSVPSSLHFVNFHNTDLSKTPKMIRVTSSDFLSVASVTSDLPHINCTIVSQDNGTSDIAVNLISHPDAQNANDITGNIIVTYDDIKETRFCVPVIISPPSCCRLISGKMQLVYSKNKTQPIFQRIAILTHHEIQANDLVIRPIESWLKINDVVYDGQYVYLTLVYNIDELPENWRGELFMVSASGHYAPVSCRGTIYERH